MTPHPRLAFYAPLKPPTHSNPSGDRLIANRLMQTLRLAGFSVELASIFRSYDRTGDKARQARLKRLGERIADRLIRHYRRVPPDQKPNVWFTYHLYHKAPDWIGPKVSDALSIPYIVAEASYAAKQLNGPWSLGLAATVEALQRADLILSLNPADREGVMQIVSEAKMAYLAPYLDLSPFSTEPAEPRITLAQRYSLNPERVWLISVAMMRPGDKAASYRLLAQSLRRCKSTNWELIVVGSGKAEVEVRQAFSGIERIHFVGKQDQHTLIPLLQAADLMVWPAVNEAFGMAFLEAQAAGSWVIAGNEGGVSSLVIADTSGTLIPPRDPEAMARAIDALTADPNHLRTLGKRAQRWCAAHHSETQAVTTLSTLLTPLLRTGSSA
ncbi:glycosyl transferase family 1 [Marinobacterium zhoushanense]|uniref:Glycosyl transferase family 1 n=1 Tax=Marinobacterium zhoushanense TaxID=1679163 RepID=A0ABQ1KGG7_9GAMM|nr:glycosyltransferase family 4 protein [Marinobacterium zhoushanense]GGB95076.1 glycosyl transferase family 1 [Marinobacterium zhoushanense]